jgi:hypothetical protein
MLVPKRIEAREDENEQVRLEAVEMSFGWPLPRYAIPVVVSVLAVDVVGFWKY